MQNVSLEYSYGPVDVALPGDAVVFCAGPMHQQPQLPDPERATHDVVGTLYRCKPLGDQVGPGSTMIIAFPDLVKGGAHEAAHRRVNSQALLDEPGPGRGSARRHRAGLRDRLAPEEAPALLFDR